MGSPAMCAACQRGELSACTVANNAAGIGPCRDRYDAYMAGVSATAHAIQGERRERIATAALAGLLSQSQAVQWMPDLAAECAVEYADALIRELDKPVEREP